MLQFQNMSHWSKIRVMVSLSFFLEAVGKKESPFWARFCLVRMCVCELLSHVWLCDPMDCSPLGSSVHEILQVRMLEWVALPFSRGSSQPRDWTRGSCTAGRFFIFSSYFPNKSPFSILTTADLEYIPSFHYLHEILKDFLNAFTSLVSLPINQLSLRKEYGFQSQIFLACILTLKLIVGQEKR